MRVVQYHVRRSFTQRMRGKAIGYAAGPHTGVASGENVDGGIADDYRLLRLSLGLLEQGAGALGIGLLGGRAVASIYMNKKLAHAKGFDDGPRRMNRFVGKHSHLAAKAV